MNLTQTLTRPPALIGLAFTLGAVAGVSAAFPVALKRVDQWLGYEFVKGVAQTLPPQQRFPADMRDWPS